MIPALQSNRNCIAVESQSDLFLPTETKIITKLSDENENVENEAERENVEEGHE